MSRKIISLITPHYSPEITAAAHRMEVAAKTLSSSYKVHVFTLTERGQRTESYDLKHDANLTVHYISQINYNKSVFFIRALFEIWYSLRLILKANSVRSDLTIITIPYIFLLPFAGWFCKADKKIADVRDLVWHYLSSKNFLKKKISKYLTRIMHKSLKKFDAITLTNEAEKRWLIQNGFHEAGLTVIPNGLSQEKYKQLTSVKYSPHSQKITITYIGNIGSSQHFYSLLNAVKEMKDVRLNLIGDGNDFKNLQSYIINKKILNVTLIGKMKWRRIVPYYQTSNILFASLKDNFDTAIPSKLYEYLATGLPIIFQGEGAGADFLRNYENTFIVKSSDSTAIENMIWNIKDLKPAKSQKNISEIGRMFIREKLSTRFVELAARLMNEKELSDVFVEEILEKMES